MTTIRIMIGLILLPVLMLALIIPPLGVNLLGWFFRR